MLTAQEIIERLGLRRHPEEGPTLGQDLIAGMVPQVVVPAGVWQGARLVAGGKWALLGCTVAPGFEFANSEHGRRESLARAYPAARHLIAALTRYDSGHDAR